MDEDEMIDKLAHDLGTAIANKRIREIHEEAIEICKERNMLASKSTLKRVKSIIESREE